MEVGPIANWRVSSVIINNNDTSALAESQELDEMVAEEASELCKKDEGVVTAKRVKKCAALYDTILTLFEPMVSVNNFFK